jgi:hypothetical protein
VSISCLAAIEAKEEADDELTLATCIMHVNDMSDNSKAAAVCSATWVKDDNVEMGNTPLGHNTDELSKTEAHPGSNNEGDTEELPVAAAEKKKVQSEQSKGAAKLSTAKPKAPKNDAKKGGGKKVWILHPH